MLTKTKVEAARRALKSRAAFGYEFDSPVDIYELIARYGLSLRFTNVASLDGLYINDGLTGSINVSGLRPAGLQRFTAAHELGHFVFGHGARFDVSLENLSSNSEDESVADTYARHLLMPKRAVFNGFGNLGTLPSTATPEQYHAVASWLGVGYTTLIQQCRWTFGAIGGQKFHQLQMRQPQQIKRAQVPSISWGGRKELWPVAPHWKGSRLHVQVGDVLTGLRQPSLDFFELGDSCAIARKPGQVDQELYGGGSVQVSIARMDYVGMYQYRYLQEDDDAGTL